MKKGLFLLFLIVVFGEGIVLSCCCEYRLVKKKYSEASFKIDKRDYTVLPLIYSKQRKIKNITRKKKYYIDYENGDDNNPGTKDKPWRHHPWDINAEGIAASTAGNNIYIFKNNVFYRGMLIPDESGEEDAPIILTNEKGWGGDGYPILCASTEIKGKWKRCTSERFPYFAPQIVDKIWYIRWKEDFIPRALFEVKGKKFVRINRARTPNWNLYFKGDIKKDWWEVKTRILEFKVLVDSTKGFKPGDKVIGTGKWFDREEDVVNIKRGTTRIVEVGRNWLKLRIFHLKKGEFKKGAYITNGRAKACILKMPGGHGILTYIQDEDNLKKFNNYPLKYWKKGIVFSERYYGTFIIPSPIIRFDKKDNAIVCDFHKGLQGPCEFSRYYIENLPFLLDEPNEFFYNEEERILFVRLQDDRDPNYVHLEAGRYLCNIRIFNCSHIKIENIEFTGCNEIPISKGNYSLYWRGALANASIIIRGEVEDIKIKRCKFYLVPNGIISAALNEGRIDIIKRIEIKNCIFTEIGGNAINLSGTSLLPYIVCTRDRRGRLQDVKIIGNKVYNVGFRNLCISWVPHAIFINDVELAEVSYNRVINSAGSGIIVRGQKFFKDFGLEVPLQRILIHNNYVKNSLLACQDYGGIAMWYGGPSYIYNNVSINPVGYKHVHYKKWHDKIKNWFRTSCFGVGIYADQGYKVYAFNNIIVGQNNDCNTQIYSSCGWNEAQGFLNTVFNNTIYNFAVGLRKGMWEANRSKYLNNLLLNIGSEFIRYDAQHIEFENLAFGFNIFTGKAYVFATVSKVWKENPTVSDLDEWKKRLEGEKAVLAQTGWITEEKVVKDPDRLDFSPLVDSVVIDRAKKVFVPWGLYKVIGEWNFYKYNKNIHKILDEHIWWNKDWETRWSVRTSTPRYDLYAKEIKEENFVEGILEDWTKGALKLDGKTQYCIIEDSNLLNIGKGNFLIEVVFKTQDNGPLVGKIERINERERKGYQLEVLDDGNVSLCLYWGNGRFFKCKTTNCNIKDDKWHHVIVEMEKRKKEIHIYVDGKLKESESKGNIQEASLDNRGYFFVGKGGEEYLECTIDFLRVALVTLKDAKTDIDELYRWEFDGPFLKDFYGRRVFGKARDVGAIEYIKD